MMIKISFNRVIRLVCGVFLCTFMFACSDSNTSSSTGVQATYSSLWDNVFSGCGVNCHNSSASSNGTDLGPDMSTKASFYTNVVGKSFSDYSSWVKNSDCNSVSFITPGSANDSSLAAALIQSVSDTLAANYNCVTAYNVHVTNSMAISDSTTQNALITWINNGAQNN